VATLGVENYRHRPSQVWVIGFNQPWQLRPGGGVIVVCHDRRLGLQVEVARVPSLQTVWSRCRLFSS
jgi:hypothetical protein